MKEKKSDTLLLNMIHRISTMHKRVIFKQWTDNLQILEQQYLDELVQDLSRTISFENSEGVQHFRQLSCVVGRLEPKTRGMIWQCLLGVQNKSCSEFDHNESMYCNFDPSIREECRSICQQMLETSGELALSEMEMVLYEFCTNDKKSYIPGLAHKLAPFFLLKLPLDAIYLCFSAFYLHFYHPIITIDITKQREVFNQLVNYHDPLLSLSCNPIYLGDAFPTYWFTCSFEHICSPSQLVYLLDGYIKSNELFFGHFLGLSLLLLNRSEILLCSPINFEAHLLALIETTFHSIDKVHDLVSMALYLFKQTPTGFSNAMNNKMDEMSTSSACTLIAFKQMENKPDDYQKSQWKRIESRSLPGRFYWCNIQTGFSQWEHPDNTYEPFPSLFCLTLSVNEILEKQSKNYFLIDCRALYSSEQVKSGYIAKAYYLDPSIFSNPEAMEKTIEILSPLKERVHICLIGHGIGVSLSIASKSKEFQCAIRQAAHIDISTLNTAACFLQKLGFPFISCLEGGFAAWHAYLRDHDSMGLDDLVGHDQNMCKYCKLDAVKDDACDEEKKRELSFLNMALLKDKFQSITSSFSSQESLFPLSKAFNKGQSTPKETTPCSRWGKKNEECLQIDYSEDEDEDILVDLPQINKRMNHQD